MSRAAVGAAQPAVWRRLAASAGPADPLAEARSRAEAVLAAAAAEAEELRRAAAAAGHADGYRQGRAEAMAELAGLLAEARQVLAAARAEREAALAAVTDDAVALAVALARAALLRRAEESCDDLVALSRTLLQEVPGPCRLRCHPADAAALGPEAVPDERVDRGGLIVEAADGEREATLGGRLARLEAALRAGGASG